MFIVIKQSWKLFFAKLLIMIFVSVTFVVVFFKNYQLGIDPQSRQCLPDHSFYLISYDKSDLITGQIYAFKSKNMQPFFEDNTTVIKVLVAKPGDTVEVNSSLEILVNNIVVSSGFMLAEKLAIDTSNFIGKKKLESDEYWFLGKTEDSFDSRYWGSVKYEQIIGKTYPIF